MGKDEVRALFAQGEAHVGDLAWWSLDQARVKRVDLEALWAREGLDTALLPEPPNPGKALKSAVREARSPGLKGTLIRQGDEDADTAIYAIVRETWNPVSEEMTYEQTSYVKLYKTGPAEGTLTTGGGDVASRVNELFGELLTTHTTDEVRRMLVRTLKGMASFSLRETGGVYWIPPHHASTLRAVARVVEQLGNSALDLLPVHASAEGLASLGKAAQASLEQELRELVSEIGDFVQAESRTGKAPRTSTLEARLESFQALRERAELYRSVLSVKVDELDGQLSDLSGIVQSMLA